MEFLTVKDIGQYLRISDITAYRLLTQKKLPGFRVGSSWRSRKDLIDKYLQEQSNIKQ